MKSKISIVLFFALVLLVNLKGFSQTGFFEQVWLDKGLSQSTVQCIEQDEKGYMWFGTQNGLNRWDGVNILTFLNEPFNPTSLSGDNILSVHAVDKNYIIVHSDGGIDAMSTITGKVIRLSTQILKQVHSEARIYRVSFVNKILFLHTTKGFYLMTFSDDFNKVKVSHTSLNEKVIAVKHSKSAGYVILTTNGIYNSNKSANEWSKNDLSVPQDWALARNIILKDKQLIVAFNDQVILFHNFKVNESREVIKKSNTEDHISGICMDNKRRLWLGTKGNGIYLYDNDFGLINHFTSSTNVSGGLKNDAVIQVFQGSKPNESKVWISTHEGGAFCYDDTKNAFRLISATLKNNFPTYFGITKDDKGVVWVGTKTGILSIDRVNKVDEFYPLKNIFQPIEALCHDQGKLYFNNEGIFSVFNIEKKESTSLVESFGGKKYNRILSIKKINRDEFFIGLPEGFAFYSDSTKSLEYIDTLLIGNKWVGLGGVSSAAIDENGIFWLATINGVFSFDRKNGIHKQYLFNELNKNSLLSNTVLDVCITPQGDLAVATIKGLSIKKKDSDTFENYTSAEGMSNNFLYGILSDAEGVLWMSSNNGLVTFNEKTKTFKSYTQSDGLLVNEFNSGGFYSSKDGELLFAGIGGIIGLVPPELSLFKSKISPEIALNLCILNGKDSIVDFNKPIECAYNQSDLSFSFSVPDYFGDDWGNLYYRINQGDWVKMNNFNLNLTKLSAESYKIQVKAITNDGLESTQPFETSIIVHPPFWRTTYFVILIFIAFVLIAIFIYRVRINRKLRRFKEMEAVRMEENEKVRKAAALDLHDEFGNGLTRISMLVEIAKLKSDKKDSELNNVLDIISDNTQRLYQGTKDFIWSISQGNDNLYEVGVRIKDFGDEVCSGTKIKFESIGLEDYLKQFSTPSAAGRNIVMAFKEAISNSLKHANAKTIKLSFSQEDDFVFIKISDDGKGFNAENKSKGFGLENIKQRAAKSGAEVQIESSASKGTLIIFTIPKLSKTSAS